jgi:hypothetical protein
MQLKKEDSAQAAIEQLVFYPVTLCPDEIHAAVAFSLDNRAAQLVQAKCKGTMRKKSCMSPVGPVFAVDIPLPRKVAGLKIQEICCR